MFQKGDRVRHINEEMNAQYGVMEVWEIKNGYAVCRYGDFHNFDLVTFPLFELSKETN